MRERWPDVSVEGTWVVLFGEDGGRRLFVWPDGEVYAERMRHNIYVVWWSTLADLEPWCKWVAGETEEVPRGQ
jgi:hypothetical protein